MEKPVVQMVRRSSPGSGLPEKLAMTRYLALGMVAGSILFTLYLTWSPWHYTAQNYGVALMFLGRRGIEVDPRTKRLLRLSLLLSFWISFLYMHGPSTYSPFLGIHVQFLSLGLPAFPAFGSTQPPTCSSSSCWCAISSTPRATPKASP